MPTSVTMPALGESVTEGTVTRWLKQEGEQVEVDEPLLEVSTDKVDTEIPSPAAGVLTKILVSEDETVEVGAELAVIGGEGDGGAPAGGSDTAAAPAQEQAPAQEAPAQPEPQPEPAAAAPSAGDGAASGGGSGDGAGTPVTMPALGESVTEGTVIRWLKSVGDEVTADEPLLEVSTDKVDTEIPAPVSGTLLSISVNEDETVEVGAQLAVIGSGAAGGGAPAQAAAPSAPAQQEPQSQEEPREAAPPAQASAPTPQADPTPQRAQPSSEAPGADYGSGGVLPSTSPTDAPSPAQAVAPQAPPAPKAPAPAGDGGGQYVTPLVRRLAAERGVDLSSVTGTGVGGRIRKQDVLAAAEQAAAPA
ncbi:biotin/lipoyl-containing protein, partial [Geodermatophilus chilensis]|uniref:biotin/lipoyl-containing protein n=1 Tax=Geodermatophilus chilensis TaxID=2035835 RepID=UPI0018E460C1